MCEVGERGASTLSAIRDTVGGADRMNPRLEYRLPSHSAASPSSNDDVSAVELPFEKRNRHLLGFSVLFGVIL